MAGKVYGVDVLLNVLSSKKSANSASELQRFAKLMCFRRFRRLIHTNLSRIVSQSNVFRRLSDVLENITHRA